VSFVGYLKCIRHTQRELSVPCEFQLGTGSVAYKLLNSAPDTIASPVSTHPKMAQSFPVPTKKQKNIIHNTKRKLNTITYSFINF